MKVTVQNKMHFSAHGHTAAEIIEERADADRDKGERLCDGCDMRFYCGYR